MRRSHTARRRGADKAIIADVVRDNKTRELKIYDMPLAVTRKFKKPIETGDGYYIKENECIKLKTPFIAGE